MESFCLKYIWLGLCMFVVSFSISFGIFPTVLRMARVWGFYDNPEERKLQQHPIPVLGGLCVYISILMSTFVLLGFAYNIKVVYMLIAMGVLLVMGMVDDKCFLSVKIRFLIESAIIILIIVLNRNYINTLGGIWGIWQLPLWIALFLSILTGVGLINAINLIDGVDGYSSSYVMFACIAFASIFFIAKINVMAILCLICAGSLLPFILHNVFGRKTKMFIGDSGTLMMGMMITVFIFSILKDGSYCYNEIQDRYGAGLVPLVLSVMSICVFDTLRVMVTRILHGKSPFHPDKGHLHHLFIGAGFSHIGTTISLLALNFMVFAGWLLSWALGAGLDLQLYVVIALGLTNTVGLYTVMTAQSKSDGKLYKKFLNLGSKTDWTQSKFWKFMQKVVDDELFDEGRDCGQQN